MVLLIAVALGLVGGLFRAKIKKSRMRTIKIRDLWLVFVAYVPQLLAFYLPPTQKLIPDNWIPILLIAWTKRLTDGFWLLGMALLANFSVITLNGGFMPIMPEVINKMKPPGSDVAIDIGQRVGFGKDMLLLKEKTALWFLGDIFVLPEWLNYPLAFSPGDILISMGAFWLLWELGRPSTNSKEVST